jgi:hypothetical protein
MRGIDFSAVLDGASATLTVGRGGMCPMCVRECVLRGVRYVAGQVLGVDMLDDVGTPRGERVVEKKIRGERMFLVETPGGEHGFLRPRVRFEDDATEVEVVGDDLPALYTSVVGLNRLISVLRVAMNAVDTAHAMEDLCAVRERRRAVEAAMVELWQKCRMDISWVCDCSCEEVSRTLSAIEQRFVEKGGWPVVYGVW